MTDKLKPVRCGCGGEATLGHDAEYGYDVFCIKCGIATDYYNKEADAITAWNRAMGEQTAKVVCHRTTMGLSFCCSNCGKPVHSEGKYCHHCRAKLEWSEDE